MPKQKIHFFLTMCVLFTVGMACVFTELVFIDFYQVSLIADVHLHNFTGLSQYTRLRMGGIHEKTLASVYLRPLWSYYASTTTFGWVHFRYPAGAGITMYAFVHERSVQVLTGDV